MNAPFQGVIEMLWIFILVFAVGAFVKFCASDTGMKFFNWLNEKKLERDLEKIDPLLVAERKARKKTIEESRNDPEILNAYAEYKANLRRNEKPVPLDDFIDAYLDSLARVANFHLKLDEDGKIIAVELEGYGEVSLDFIKETEPRAYKQIMDAYENFKRESGIRD